MFAQRRAESHDGFVGPIAIILPTLGIGGAERVSLALSAELLQRGYAVDLVVSVADGPLRDRVANGVRVIDLRAPRIRQVPISLARYMRDSRPSGVIANIWPLTLAAAITARAVRPYTPIVTCHHNHISVQYIERRNYSRQLMAVALKIEQRLSTAVIGCSAGVGMDVELVGRLPKGSVATVTNPVHVPEHVAAADLAIAERHWPVARGRRLVAVGNFKSQKNFPLLIEAFSKVAKLQSAHLIIVGDGEGRAELHSLIERLGLVGKVSLPGWSNSVEAFYRTADLYVMSSDHEGLPTVLIEALGSGLPVVSTDCPAGPREILLDGVLGRLVPCRDVDALATAMAEALEFKWDTEALRRRAADFAPGRAADRYLSLLFGA